MPDCINYTQGLWNSTSIWREVLTVNSALIRMFLLSFALAALSPLALSQQPRQPDHDLGYPNELPGYRFYAAANWRTLTPLVATMKDVRGLLGPPDEANDVSEYTSPYPGDAIAKKPVFTYKLNGQWDMLIYFARYCFHEHPHDIPGDRLCSVDLIPRKRIPFVSVQFPSAFAKKHVDAADAAWDEYEDGTGLRYEVYTTKTPYGGSRTGDLNRISYGPPVMIGNNAAR